VHALRATRAAAEASARDPHEIAIASRLGDSVTSKPEAKAQPQAKQTLAALAEFYPIAFGLPARPLKIGIHLDLIERAPVTAKETREALRCHCGSFSYLRVVVEGADRIDLDGKPTVTLGDQTTLLKGPFRLVRKGAHSAKPIEAYAYFESLFPAPRYFDLFSRYQHSELWDPHGAEAPAQVAEPAS
jgi:hypothetical protein